VSDAQLVNASDVRHGRQILLLWSAGITTLVLSGLFCWLLLVPYLQTRAALARSRMPGFPMDTWCEQLSNETARLGGPEIATRKLALYLSLPERLAPNRDMAAAMLRYCGAHATPRLLRLLTDNDPEVRRMASLSLFEIVPPGDAIPSLLEALNGIDSDLRQCVVEAIGNTRDRRAADPLLALLGDPDYAVRARAATGLAKLRDRRAVEPLIALLQDKEQWVQEEAAKALGDIGDPRAIPALTLLAGQIHYLGNCAACAASDALEKLKAGAP